MMLMMRSLNSVRPQIGHFISKKNFFLMIMTINILLMLLKYNFCIRFARRVRHSPHFCRIFALSKRHHNSNVHKEDDKTRNDEADDT